MLWPSQIGIGDGETSGPGPELMAAATYPTADQLAKRLGIPGDELHTVKDEILHDLKDLVKQTRNGNPDIGIDDHGNITLRPPRGRPGKEVYSDVPIDSFSR